jgi:hypothetical protein
VSEFNDGEIAFKIMLEVNVVFVSLENAQTL